ncbi:MAG: phosphatidylserine decarboxylase [Bacteroidetes bacterium]|nr:MAG: phosphatidylserine decarboxylase [Bacteroidota bacterium]
MIHREGYATILWTFIFLAILNLAVHFLLGEYLVAKILAYAATVALTYIILQFFRNPARNTVAAAGRIIAPADGKVVVMEEVSETEYFNGEKRLQISIFMSPFNVHVNRYPIAGKVKYVKYHPGKYLVAWHPKSSTENERTTIVVEDDQNRPVLFRQIAGAMARRIVYYAKENDPATAGGECGFIKFGSRVDLLLPPGVQVKVKLNQVVTGGETVIAEFA